VAVVVVGEISSQGKLLLGKLPLGDYLSKFSTWITAIIILKDTLLKVFHKVYM